VRIAIIGNGQSALKINFEKELIDKDIIVRLKLGTIKKLYYSKEIFSKNHHAVLHPYNLKKMDNNELKFLSELYSKIFFLSYSFFDTIIEKCSNLVYDKIILPNASLKDISFKETNTLSYFGLYNSIPETTKLFNKLFYKHIHSVSSKSLNNKIYASRDGNFFSHKTLSLVQDVIKLKNFTAKQNFKNTTLYPSIGLTAVVAYTIMYPEAKIYLYGYDFNNDSGWFWDKQHKHDKNVHDFYYEKSFITNCPYFKNVIIC